MFRGPGAHTGDSVIEVVAYADCVPARNKNPQKAEILPCVIQGVQAAGDSGHLVTGADLRSARVAVIQGWVHQNSSHSRHLNLRRSVIQHQRATGGHVMTADSNLFLYANVNNPHNYLRYSLDGVFPDTGCYFDTSVDPGRWQQIARDHAITVKPWRTRGQHILICSQRDGGWSMGSVPVLDWLARVILEIRRHSDRPIVIRTHPGDKQAQRYIGEFNQAGVLTGVTLSAPGRSLSQDLDQCWAVVNHNSSPAVAAVIEGIPIFLTDADRSQACDMANRDLGNIENPIMPERRGWLERIAMSHWSFQDWRSGRAWAHIRKHV